MTVGTNNPRPTQAYYYVDDVSIRPCDVVASFTIPPEICEAAPIWMDCSASTNESSHAIAVYATDAQCTPPLSSATPIWQGSFPGEAGLLNLRDHYWLNPGSYWIELGVTSPCADFSSTRHCITIVPQAVCCLSGPQPTASVSVVGSCAPVRLTATPSGGSGAPWGFQWQRFTGGFWQPIFGATGAFVDVDEPGDYAVTVFDVVGCRATVPVQAVQVRRARAVVSCPELVCEGDTVWMDASASEYADSYDLVIHETSDINTYDVIGTPCLAAFALPPGLIDLDQVFATCGQSFQHGKVYRVEIVVRNSCGQFFFDPHEEWIVIDCCSGPCGEPTKTIPAGIKSWWSLDESAGPTAADLAGGWGGTWGNSPTQFCGNLPVPAAGVVCGCLDFDCSSVFVGGIGAPWPGPTGLTIVAWVNTRGNPNNRPELRIQPIVDKPINGFALFLKDLDGNNFYLGFDPGDMFAVTSGYYRFFAQSIGPITPNEWTHVAVTLRKNDQAGGLFFVNGQPLDADAFSTVGLTMTRGIDLRLGASPFPIINPGSAFNGKIDEVMIFDRPLARTEIETLYEARSFAQESCYVPLVTAYCQTTAYMDVELTICNAAAEARTYRYSVQGLPVDPDATGSVVSGPLQSEILLMGSGQPFVTVGPGDCVSVPIRISRPSSFGVAAIASASYRVIVEDLSSAACFGRTGTLTAGYCTGGSSGIVQTAGTSDIERSWVGLIPGESIQLTFEIHNLGLLGDPPGSTLDLAYSIVTLPAGDPTPVWVSLDGQVPGLPVEGFVSVPVGESRVIPVRVRDDGVSPFQWEDVLLIADVDADGSPEILESVGVRSMLPCRTPVFQRAGDVDSLLASGEPADAIRMRPEFADWVGRTGGNNQAYHGGAPMPFDVVSVGNWEFGYSFSDLPHLESATLVLHVRGSSATNPVNDALSLQFLGGSPNFIWGRSFAQIDSDQGGDGVWRVNESMVVSLDLSALPTSGPTLDLLPIVNAAGYLDVFLQDDTAIDYIELRGRTCRPNLAGPLGAGPSHQGGTATGTGHW